ncbi:MAG: ATP-binding cassette domain-containing protein [Bacteroidales bacterium]|jgi:ABC-type multidrug transport system ATPase subunit|nr:ATP-binding cassette domain-containing protein [Bacteroidales bacterium]
MGLHVDSILKSYGSRQILTDVFLTCNKGEIIGLLGRNGSGKSTLLKIIFGSLSAQNNYVRVGDRTLNTLSERKYLIRYLPQNSFLPGHIRLKKAISLFCDTHNAEKVRNHHLIYHLMEQKCKDLSGGEKRVAEILMVIYSEAGYIMIDEPFNGVAPVYKEEIKKLIREESEKKGFIITDHDYRNILDISTKILLIHDGGIKTIKEKEELRRWNYLSSP